LQLGNVWLLGKAWQSKKKRPTNTCNDKHPKSNEEQWNEKVNASHNDKQRRFNRSGKTENTRKHFPIGNRSTIGAVATQVAARHTRVLNHHKTTSNSST
jgi:hypothetical protein